MVQTYTNVLPDSFRLAALAAFPPADWPWWHRYGNGKLATVDPSRIPSACRVALERLASVCEPVAGFYDFDFYGAGMHLMPAGTSLGIHKDATHHGQRPWRRLASLVYFLEDCDGGELVIEGEEIKPVANMAVTFPSQQSHEVLAAISDRKTLSLFVWEVDYGPKETTSATFTQ